MITCGSRVTRIEKALRTAPGVVRAKVNAGTDGYTTIGAPRPASPGAVDRETAERDGEYRALTSPRQGDGFVRATEPGQTGFVEQAIALADIKPGWIVSVATKHEGDREVAELVKVVLER